MTAEDNGPSILSCLLLFALILGALWIRCPRINEGLPYFYREDEAHHYNRLVNMVKSGDLNPHYFHKPSLHFYLRIPAVAAGFLMGVRKGYFRSVKEIQTKDTFGVADYSFSTSHPIIAKSARWVSMILSLLLVAVTYLLVKELTGSIWPSLAGGVLVAVSPALIEDSAVIGVDILMATFCLFTSWAGVRLIRKFSLPLLALTGVLSGLAVSSKYNALPIMLIPILVCILTKKWEVSAWVIAFVAPVLGFFLGSPYIITSIPLFLDQLGYEIWHYGIAAHEGHSAEPGMEQALFYLNWLNDEALGPIATSFGIVGLLALFFRNRKEHLVLVSFPILFSILMIEQRTNFTRNMLVIIPYLVMVSVLTAWLVLEVINVGKRLRAIVFAIFIGLSVLMPVSLSLKERAEAKEFVDSRTKAIEWLSQNELQNADTALSGQLQFPLNLNSHKGYSRIDTDKLNLIQVLQAGFGRVVLPVSFKTSEQDKKFSSDEKVIQGTSEELRIVKDPTIKILKLEATNEILSELVTPEQSSKIQGSLGKPFDCGSKSEHYCWLNNRLNFVTVSGLAANTIPLEVKVMTPWANQKITFQAGAWRESHELTQGSWNTIILTPPNSEIAETTQFKVYVDTIHTPKSQGLSTDERRLGVALEQISYKH